VKLEGNAKMHKDKLENVVKKDQTNPIEAIVTEVHRLIFLIANRNKLSSN